ncbi:MAG: isopeptide-forming domain-containing fimbrial protein [Finegoldia magna]|uniref:isopeptide-forming domain-containing fimbrial protein n=1 Tax=Finegoldia magna TaxID=1260 RepID=UPI001CE1D947|nr:isopeptide-forming domain-containing fimbrial protein [Finegoldia magna]MCA5587376.1 isopeptide-forming domain-containing fimbrial protein [Finegoldia magna]MDU1010845.1 isopeptide-forming domain-containing fimbrial protein [Finegoldia magna]MDU1086639.1 isopeptide-forming domain-containing fimbrial protein [Finegoldia magna]MDU4278310.1 isopeptide-forming domain-containing fimbrial protein [Finegoldia magna]
MKKRFLSLIIALAMMVGVFTPLLTSAEPARKDGAPADQKEASTTSTIDIHKIVMEAGVLKDWKPEEHTTNGGKIEGENIQKFFGAKSKEVAEVYFEVYKEVPAGTAGTVTGEELNKKYPSKEIDTTKAYQKVAEKMTTANGTGSIDLTEFLDKDGEKVKDTKFVIVENLEKSTYKENNKTLSKEGKAIPSAIVLPATIMGGDVLHLYPKNTDAEKPDVVKDYKEEFKTGDEAKNDALNNKRDQETIDKDKKDHQIGDKLDYRVETLFKENTSYQTAYWQDSMTAGLTYNQDLKVFIDGKAAAPEDYEIEKNDATGFYVSLTEKGLAKVNGAEKHLVALEYSATLNEKAIVNIPESNDVDFFYGNDQKRGNTPKTTKPKDKKITVNKEWDNGTFADGESATFQLYDASTGEAVGDPVTINKDKPTHTWENLNDEKSYKPVEINRQEGEETSYEVTEQGTIKVVNYKGNNKEINPKEPKVVQHGKKFVKLDEKTNERLAGAEFVVMDSTQKKYLVQKSAEQAANDRQEYTKEKAIYDQYIADKDQAKADAQYPKVKAAYDKLNTKYDWSTDAKDANLVKLVSNENGQFAIDGLADGTYYLKETVAPKGYAEIKEPQKFEISENSWASEGNIEFTKNQEGKDKIAAEGTSAMKVGNRNLTIPQTGGIGTIIFTAIGLAIMASAIIAIKKRQATEAR